MANMGYGSRNQVKLMLRSGKITVNGEIAKDGARHIIPRQDQVACLGEVIDYREFIYLMLNKPAGVISATDDLKERTVLDLINAKYCLKGLFPVGRLDKDTEGLLILTNDGVLGHRLLAPRKHVAKRYFAKIDSAVGAEDIEAFRDGIVLDDGYRTMPARLDIIKPVIPVEVFIEIYEGKYHQIKRMIQALGKEVIYLKRIAMGNLELDPELKPGEYRELSEVELINLSEKWEV